MPHSDTVIPLLKIKSGAGGWLSISKDTLTSSERTPVLLTNRNDIRCSPSGCCVESQMKLNISLVPPDPA